MVIQQDNTCPSTSLNTFIDKASPETTSQHTHAERLAPLRTHIPQHPYFCRQLIHSRNQNRQVHKNAPHAFVGQPRKNHQNLDKHCLFVAVSRKTSPQIAHIDTSKPVGIAARSPTPNDKTYGAVPARVYRSPAIIPRNLHGVPHSIQSRVDLNTLTRSRSIHNRDKHSLRNAAQPPKHRFNTRACARVIAPPTMQSTHSQLSAPPTHCFML